MHWAEFTNGDDGTGKHAAHPLSANQKRHLISVESLSASHGLIPR
jgi:hypothetical protein